MSEYKSFAVAGVGRVGSFIVDELLKAKAARTVDTVVVLTRSAERNEALAANGASLVIVDYTAPSSLQPALQGIDVLICTFGVTALAVQAPLAEAAKLVGVQLSIPSEFGGNTAGKSEGPLAHKNAHLAQVQQIGIPWTVFYTGPFADWVWYQPLLGFDVANGKIQGVEGAGMTSYRTLAVVGINGILGKHFIDVLPEAKAAGTVDRIVVLARSGNDVLSAKGLEPFVVDYDAPSTLQSALQGIDVLISLLHLRSPTAQDTLAQCAKGAEVNLFIPSEYGGNTTARKEEPMFGPKHVFHVRLEGLGLPWAAFFTGLFADWVFYQAFLGFDLEKGKAEAAGSGDEVLS